MKEKLKLALMKRFPEMKDFIAERCVTKYLNAVMPELITQFMSASKEDLANGEIDFPEYKVIRECERIQFRGHQEYIYTLMNEHPTTALIIVTYKGNSLSKRVSRVTFNQNYKKEIMEAMQSLEIELDPKHLDELEEMSNADWDINAESLASYIVATRETLKSIEAIGTNKSNKYQETLIRNLRIANELIQRCKEKDGQTFIREYWEEIDSGRIHGHGISLQRIPKQVRHAALGHCHKYDFKAASYALMTSLALKLDPEIKVAALKDYIKNRAVIRKRIAADVGISEDWMKNIFTSLGFGAVLKDSPYNSIRGMIGQDKYHVLISNVEFVDIKNALDRVSDTINKHFANDTFELCGRTYKQINPKDGRKRTKNQKLAWIYQCLESHAMSLLASMIPEQYKTMLFVHDCIYLDKRLPAQRVADIKWQLSTQYPLLNFEHEEITPIHANADHGKQEREIDNTELAHKQFIAHQEGIAENYTPLNCTTDATTAKKRQVMTPWGLIDEDLYEPHQTAPKDDNYFKGGY